MPSRAASAAIRSWSRWKPRLLSSISTWKCLRTRQRFQTSPTASPIAALPRRVPCGDRCSISASARSVGGEQLLALAGALGGDERVAADDQALVRVVVGGDLGQVLLVEERELQVAVFHQLLHLRRLAAR